MSKEIVCKQAMDAISVSRSCAEHAQLSLALIGF